MRTEDRFVAPLRTSRHLGCRKGCASSPPQAALRPRTTDHLVGVAGWPGSHCLPGGIGARVAWPPLLEEPTVDVCAYPGWGSSPGHGGAYQMFWELDVAMSPARFFSLSRTTDCVCGTLDPVVTLYGVRQPSRSSSSLKYLCHVLYLEADILWEKASWDSYCWTCLVRYSFRLCLNLLLYKIFGSFGSSSFK